MLRSTLAVAILILGAGGLRAFDLKQLDATVFDRLAKKASDSVNITLDAGMLKAAKGFIPAGDADSAQVRKLIEGLTGVSVRTFEFKAPGAYTQADLDAILALVHAPWQRIVDVKDENESTQIYMLPGAEKPMGLFVLAAESQELTVVQIDGPINLQDLSSLKGIGVDLGGLANTKDPKGKK